MRKMDLLSTSHTYSRVENEDPDERKHRRAQFLIYKAMQKADARSRPSWLRVKIFKLKIKIGKRMKRLKRGFSSAEVSSKSEFYKQVTCVFKSCKYLLHGKQGPVVRTLPPVL